MFKYPKVNYIGNKEKIAKWICDQFPQDAETLFDAFSGGCSLSYEAKCRGLEVYTNDILEINYHIANSLIKNNLILLNKEDIDIIFSGNPFEGFMFNNYSEVYFFPEECKELDLYRANIEKLDSEEKKSLAFTLIRRAMIRKMPYSRFNLNWDKIVQLRDEEYSYETFDLLGKVKADIIYLDPPYTGTMNNYFGFYGLIDDFITSKKTEPFENNFINKNIAGVLFDKLFSKLSNFKYWYLSYNNSSYPSKDELLYLLNKYSDNVQVIERKHDYKITGKQKKQTNKEYLFIVENNRYQKNTIENYATAEL